MRDNSPFSSTPAGGPTPWRAHWQAAAGQLPAGAAGLARRSAASVTPQHGPRRDTSCEHGRHAHLVDAMQGMLHMTRGLPSLPCALIPDLVGNTHKSFRKQARRHLPDHRGVGDADCLVHRAQQLRLRRGCAAKGHQHDLVSATADPLQVWGQGLRCTRCASTLTVSARCAAHICSICTNSDMSAAPVSAPTT